MEQPHLQINEKNTIEETNATTSDATTTDATISDTNN